MKTRQTILYGALAVIFALTFIACKDDDGGKDDDDDGGKDGLQKWTAVTDSISWENILGTSEINAIAYGNGTWVAVGGLGKIATSANGASWTAVEDSTFGYSYIYAIAYGNNRFVAGGMDGKMAYSDDGEDWTAVSNSTFGSSYIYAIAYGNGKWVAVGDDGKIAYSDDGETWAEVTDSTFPATYTITFDDDDPYSFTSSYRINATAFGNNRFVAGGMNGTMAYSDDGITWTAVTDSILTNSINSIAYGNNKFVAGGSFGEMATSSDGVTWTAVEDSILDDFPSINGIAYGGGRFVAVRDDSKIAYSDNGASWTAVADSKFPATQTIGDYDFPYPINGIAYGGGRFVAVGDDGKMAYADW